MVEQVRSGQVFENVTVTALESLEIVIKTTLSVTLTLTVALTWGLRVPSLKVVENRLA